MSDDGIVHLETVFGADLLVWRSGMATVCPWDDAPAPGSRELAKRAAGEEVRV